MPPVVRIRAIRAALVLVPLIAVGVYLLASSSPAQHLTFGAPISGVMTASTVHTCGDRSQDAGSREVAFSGDVGNQHDYAIDMVFLNNNGAAAVTGGTYDVSFNPEVTGPNLRTVAVHFTPHGSPQTAGGITGTVTLNDDLKSGHMDLHYPLVSGRRVVLSVSGEWHC